MKKVIRILSLLIFLIILSGCFKLEDKELKEINLQLEGMSIREKIGQMLIIYNDHTYLTEDFKEELIENQVGGYIIFDRNITTYNDTKKFIEDVSNSTKIPMFIAVDQEGGKVQRLLSVSDKDATYIPDMSKVGDYNNPNLSYNIGTIIGKETRSLGINLVFSPVLDVGNYKTSPLKKRLLSNNPEIVANNGIELAKGIYDSGVIPVFKHFPGIADTTVDSHYDLPVINKTIEDLRKKELIPFIKAINNDRYQAEMMMIGHVNYPLITNNNIPSSLSKEIVNDLLRDELGYNGVVIIDAINMDALRDNYSEKEIFELGINASIDIFLMPDDSKIAIDYIEELLESGKITEEQIDNSVRRILKLKRKYLNNFTSLEEEYFGNEEHEKVVSVVK